ncbi:MAG: YCF48-related protein [Fuerstiella sp.]|nr:YCF48-related protein [Fuerstiella sp.]
MKCAAQHTGPEPDEGELAIVSEELTSVPFFSGPVPRRAAIADDASLNDVCCVGHDVWAVGDRGVIVRSNDDGTTWQTSILPLECSLQSVCFLTNQIGFVAGSRFDHFARQYYGILLKTRNGGDSWQHVATKDEAAREPRTLPSGNHSGFDLPPLSYVRFFDLNNGVAVGRLDSTVLRTSDGGRTWRSLKTEKTSGRWTSGAFLTPEDGIVVGAGSSYGTVVGEQLVTLAQPLRTFRRVNAASLARDRQGWLVGDGGFLLQSQDGGVSWVPPTGRLPTQLNDVFDFFCVDRNGTNVCVAGSPGGVVVHSHDDGRSWTFRQVSSSAPLRQIRFIDATTVLAVGAFGVIHRSQDSGKTWAPVRNGNYRAAVMCLVTDPEDVPMRMLASISGDQGFRSVVVQPSASLVGEKTEDQVAAYEMQVAIAQAGGNQFVQDWMFARTQPLQELVRDELLTSWARQTDGRVSELLPQRLAETIRVWRPDVICIERHSDTDEVAQIWLQAVHVAMNIAAGHDQRGAILDTAGLAPWQVSHVFRGLASQETSPLTFPGDALLPNLGTTADLISNHCLRLTPAVEAAPQATLTSATSRYAAHSRSAAATATPTHFFSGNLATPRSPSRRSLNHASPEDRRRLEQISQQDKTLRAALTGHLSQRTTPLGLIAHLKTLGADLPDSLALQQLQNLADLYKSKDNLEGMIAVLKETINRFPRAPQSAHAAEQLFQFYSSEELRFLRRNGSEKSVQNGIQPINFALPMSASGTAPIVRAGRGTLLANPSGSDRRAVDAQWNKNAQRALQALHSLAPEVADSPRLQLRQAANVRRAGEFVANSTLLAKAAAGNDLFSLLARAEQGAVHGAAATSVPTINLPKVRAKPVLDGLLTEKCWLDAIELHLAPSAGALNAPPTDCLMMLAWDDDHIYIAGRIEHCPGHSNSMDHTADRFHDAKHGILDRVVIGFDVDRDYTTSFEFVIDESGQTSERCWTARSWNPQWFVDAEADDTSWRFEVAIPHAELQATPLRAGSLWGIRLQRLAPGIVEQSLTDPEAENGAAHTNGHGLLRFIRNRK